MTPGDRLLHPELEAEQAYIDYAYQCLAEARERATTLRGMVEVGQGGTEQARFEREVIFDTIAQRLVQLHLGDASLVFGRIDTEPPPQNGHAEPPSGDAFYIGRVAVADPNQEVVVVDWRAPVAEPFYRATGRSPMGLARRRHFATRGRSLLDIEDELFGDRALGLGDDDGISGHGALIAALETARSGRLGDIVATIQGEQDEIIRAPMPGVLVVQGGPGTGKTVVALHRAAYLLYTHRFPLEDQGVLVIGPNRLFLGYIEQVLPSLGEAGVELAVLGDLIDAVRVRDRDTPAAARVKGDARMVKVLAKAVRDRKRPLRQDLVVGYGLTRLRVTVAESERIVADARRRARHHNGGRRFVEAGLFEALAASSRSPLDAGEIRSRLRHDPLVREALERMWPVLTPAELLHDLFGSKGLLELAGRQHLSVEERAALHRPRSETVEAVVWRTDDVPLLDEARALLGATPKAKKHGDSDEVRTYGHIVVDEAQDLSPMQLRMLGRRSLNGSMTIVGDIAQSTGAWAHASWDEILDLLPQRREPRRAELTVGYRIPGPNMDLAAKVLVEAAPELRAPRSVRQDGRPPRVVPAGPADGGLAATVLRITAEEVAAVGTGNVAVIAPGSLVEPLAEAFTVAGVEHGVATQAGLANQITIVPVGMVKGLELDATVVVEPATILAEEPQPMRSLYVALTRATKLLTIVHDRPLPPVLHPDPLASSA
ncbi:MAG TPA: UvrD-helicase domain-containing protein [Iamia sp.]|nr:UvrD-helicase domain-containing protein [Iamia sp.]